MTELSRYQAILWRQAGQILFALDTLDRRKLQERRRTPSRAAPMRSIQQIQALARASAGLIAAALMKAHSNLRILAGTPNASAPLGTSAYTTEFASILA